MSTSPDQALGYAGFFDRDNTLAPRKGEASPQVRRMIDFIDFAGLGVSIVTVLGERRLAQDGFPLRLPVIVEAGGAARFQDGTLLTFPMSQTERTEVANTFLQAAIDGKITYAAFYPKDSEDDSKAIIFAGSDEIAADFATNPKLQPVIRDNGIITDPQVFADFVKRMYAEVCMVEIGAKDQEDILPASINHTIADGTTIVTASGVDKGSTVMAVANMLGIPSRRIITAGDQPVDQPMLRAVSEAGGISIAVNNPTLEADHYVATPQELAELVEQLQIAAYVAAGYLPKDIPTLTQ